MCTVGERGSCILRELQAEDLGTVSPEAIGEELQALRRHINECEAEFQRRLQRFDRGEGYSADGALTARAWLRWKCHLSPTAASDRVQTARRLASLELTEAAFMAGEIGYPHAALIARTAAELGDKWDRRAEEILVTAAKELDPGRLRFATIHLRHCLEPDGVLAEANQSHERRLLHMSQTLDGVYYVDGRLDAEGGAALKTALDALMRPPTAGDVRSPAERRADALVEMARLQLDAGSLPAVGGQKPHLVVTVEMGTLCQVPGSPAAELEWSQPIPAETARRIACDCALTPVVDGEAQGTGRVVPGSLRRALVARDRGCRFPGCDMPAAWTDAHHIRHWADGGPTKLWNLILMCRRHHRLLHEGGWQLVGAGDNLLQAVPPP
jgi:Domain of unknown function (DUF222)/HNH endonuclease